MLNALRLSLQFLVVSIGLSVSLGAQDTSGIISGTVQDESRAVLPGATVTVTNAETGVARTIFSDEKGRFRAAQLRPGSYRVRAELPGFRSAVREGLTLTVGGEAVVDLVLAVGELTEELVVTGEAPLVERTGAVMSGFVGERQIRELPLNGRSYVQLATLEGGVNLMRVSNDGPSLSVAGGRSGQNNFLLDGTNINDNDNKTPVSQAGVSLGVETIREFTVLTSNYSAEFGRGSGGIINAVTKSGTNDLHGTLFAFHRNDALDAPNYFDVANEAPDFERNQYGASLGGPIKKNRAFFFAAYEGLRQRLNASTISRTFGEQIRQGLVPGSIPGQFIQISVSPAIKPYLGLFPLPNGRVFDDGTGEFHFTDEQIVEEHFAQLRSDYEIGPKDSLFARYTYSDSFVRSAYAFPDFFQSGNQLKHIITIEEKRIISPDVLNVFRFGFNRNDPRIDDYSPNTDPALSFSPGRAFGSIGVTGVSPLGTGQVNPKILTQNSFQLSNGLTMVKGAHSLKLGAQLERIAFDFASSSRIRGSYNFNSTQDFLEGRAARFEIEPPATEDQVRVRQNIIAWYIQDDLQVTPRLTVNLGLRHEFFTTPTEVDGKVLNIRDIRDPNPVVHGDPFFKNPSYNDFAPRLGMAWDPFGNGKTAVRAGVGAYFNPIMLYEIRNAFSDLPPLSNRVRVNNPPFPNGLAAAETGLAVILPKSAEFEPASSYMLRWNFDVQREILPGTLASIGYVGSRGVHLMHLRDINEPPATTISADGREFRALGAPRVNPKFSEVRQSAWDASSSYHSLQATVKRRFANGFQAHAAYTFSKSIDTASGYNKREFGNSTSIASTPLDVNFDRGLSNFHTGHMLSSNFSIELPFGQGRPYLSDGGGFLGAIVGGWDLQGIISLASGNPSTVTVGFDRDRNDETDGDRPNLVPGMSNNPILGGPDQYFDPSVFELQPAGYRGDLGRNTLIGPGFATVDMSLVKNVKVAVARVQLRLEAFNVLDRANFRPPQFPALFDSRARPLSAPGRLTPPTASSARQFQLGFRLLW